MGSLAPPSKIKSVGLRKMVIVGNAFSLGMLAASPVNLRVTEVTIEEVKALIQEGFDSAVGHESTARILSALLGVEVPFNRKAVSLSKGDRLVVFQLLTRLEEGKVLTEEEVRALPYRFYLVEITG